VAHSISSEPRRTLVSSSCRRVGVGLVTLAAGLAGRLELGVEIRPEPNNGGAGRAPLPDAISGVSAAQ
jgi:hypothetical protein